MAAGAQKPRAQYTTTKKAKATADATATKVAKDFGFNSTSTKKAVAKGSVAKTFDLNKLKPKMTAQDKAMLKILQNKYGKDVYKG
jgi:hypothetical protein